MISPVTGRTYDDVDVVFVDSFAHTVSDLEGTVYRELQDRSRIGSRGGEDAALRYSWHYAHAGGVFLKPFCELVDGAWVNLLTGVEEPQVSERSFS